MIFSGTEKISNPHKIFPLLPKEGTDYFARNNQGWLLGLLNSKEWSFLFEAVVDA